MERNYKKKNEDKKLFAAILATNVIGALFQVQSAYATNITGAELQNGAYNISASKVSNETGFREYSNFELSKGDIANLLFKNNSGEYSKFVNLVDNQLKLMVLSTR